MERAAESTKRVILESERLRFATWSREDWPELRTLATDPQVVRYISAGRPWSNERTMEFVSRQCGNWERSHFCMWKLLPKESDALIGICGLQPLPETTEIEIGWWLAPGHWGKGLATEAARLAMAYGFEVARLDRIMAIAQPANHASVHVMEKLGMKFEKEMVSRGFNVVLYAIARWQYTAGVMRAEVSPPPLNPAQVARLERLLKAGYQFTTFEQFARFPAAEKAGFVALLDISGDAVKQFGSVGFHLGSGIGVLIERPGGKAFVWKHESRDATPELLTQYEQVKAELAELLNEGAATTP